MSVERLITVRLHGPLAESYGEEHRFAVRSPREAVFALDANYPGFRRDFIKYKHYALLVDGVWLPPDAANGDPASAPASQSIDIAPVIEGRVFVLAPLVGAALGVAATSLTAQIISGVILAAIMIGVSLLLAPKAKKKTEEDTKKDENYMFSGPENVTEQGIAVPVVYGRVHVGSVVISAGLELGETYIPALATTTPSGGSGTTTGPPLVIAIPSPDDPALHVYGPEGWIYIGWGSDYDSELGYFVTGHVFMRPDYGSYYNSGTGDYYIGVPPSLTYPREPESGGQP